jgi:hypothetical protein
VADVGAIRSRIATRLKTVSGLSVLDFMPPAVPGLPAALVAPVSGVFATEVTGDGCEDLEFVVTVLVSKTVDENAQNIVDTFISEGSANLANAVESGSTADWDWAICSTARNYGAFVFGSGDQAMTFLGFELPVTVGVS